MFTLPTAIPLNRYASFEVCQHQDDLEHSVYNLNVKAYDDSNNVIATYPIIIANDTPAKSAIAAVTGDEEKGIESVSAVAAKPASTDSRGIAVVKGCLINVQVSVVNGYDDLAHLIATANDRTKVRGLIESFLAENGVVQTK